VGGTRKARASVKEVDLGGAEEEGYGYYKARSPRDRHKECMVCHVYPIKFRGTEPDLVDRRFKPKHVLKDGYTGRLLYVCKSCSWRIKNAPDFEAVIVK
jgi:hypothetical protein